jgi:hypothetical protein
MYVKTTGNQNFSPTILLTSFLENFYFFFTVQQQCVARRIEIEIEILYLLQENL